MDFREMMDSKYRDLLVSYIKDESEQALYQGQKFSRKSIEHKISPEDIISLHKYLMMDLYPDLPEHVTRSFDILLEVMMGYGLAYREHQSLRHVQQEIRSEMEIASNVQQTLLRTEIPDVESIDIGAISVPAKMMNGDYHHFVQDEDKFINIAIADVIGKGIPAALCMSMIKYAMDSLPENRNFPSKVLENLNRVVEQNVDPSMFITMFYGAYEMQTHIFHYASAGHEPGFFFEAKTGEFSDLEAKGLLLGVDKQAKYKQFEKEVNIGDMIILMSDGVTECRTEEGFIEKETLIGYIKKHIHLKAQEIVNNVYEELVKIQDFQLRDDFTLIIFKREV
ncbi:MULTISPECIES: PP2C family protein-serine/threonine phosphatase [Bacillaceae]|uniref:PP2C family protein-serine/threonine phosphatase n=1 Tax=Bacillaceae TaxID=186817 RepID=UPI001E525530|nr:MULTISPECIES: PP2C family protein-serine/threonine phosphatase [Bacillaceae]MCE4050693.1 PP2C family protein-serine/threonine phosphatase [Bacillus sp. Au-Bac7]MCM3031907.1 PP2C family protein-serine/threonine phosphatase [Niallia sp. MER 6]MDL0436088.1 PP2C family protein-serine/threonine phosphatase [Niallia sp. SS-2023]UPO87945.1 PP2C family protein-serine/threonine phosphatase [Niallia sp. Man26]